MGCAFIFVEMKALKNTTQLLSEARQLEEASRLTEAADLYQQLVDADASDQQAVTRLLTVYRRLKEPRKELAVIEAALDAYAQRNKTIQEKWLSAHPQAAKAGRAFLRSLGGSNVPALGSNPVVGRLLKRKEVVEKKIHGKERSSQKSAAKAPAARKRPAAPAARKAAAAAVKSAAIKSAAAKKIIAAKKAAAAAKKAAAAAAKAKRAEAQKQAAEQKRQAAEERQQAAEKKRQAAEERKQASLPPSLFIISLRYLALQEELNALLSKHIAFLDKHVTAGDFLAAGDQVPRTGGIIIARAKDRAALERLMHQDPFLKRKLASVDIVEFTPRSGAKELLRRRKS
jgi:uncharacterized protein YciI